MLYADEGSLGGAPNLLWKPAPLVGCVEKASELGDCVLCGCWLINVDPAALVPMAPPIDGVASRFGRIEAFLWPLLRRNGFSFGCRGLSKWVLKVVGLASSRLTVGGGLGLPSESSTLVLVLLASCSSKNARSRRILATWRFMRSRRARAASFSDSTSLVRCLSWMHFLR